MIAELFYFGGRRIGIRLTIVEPRPSVGMRLYFSVFGRRIGIRLSIGLVRINIRGGCCNALMVVEIAGFVAPSLRWRNSATVHVTAYIIGVMLWCWRTIAAGAPRCPNITPGGAFFGKK